MIERLIRTHLAGIRAVRILDIGPGYADFSRVAAGVTGAKSITFLDCDSAVLAWQTEECRKAGIRAEAVSILLDVKSLSSVSGSFDLIHCQEVLEHLPSAGEVMRAIVGLLVPGGRTVITVPTRMSERWLKFINPSYMRDVPHGHVNEFDRLSIELMVDRAGLVIEKLVPTQPHYFIAHTWLFGTRMRIEASTGRILTGGFRARVYGRLNPILKTIFMATGMNGWGRLIPRNYFILARKRAQ